MPLFGQPDPAEKLFKEAKRYSNPKKAEFNLDIAIQYLKEAVLLKPDKGKYREELSRIYVMKLERQSASELSKRIALYNSLLETVVQSPNVEGSGSFAILETDESPGNFVQFAQEFDRSAMIMEVGDPEQLDKRGIEALQGRGFSPPSKESPNYQKRFAMPINTSDISQMIEWCFREVLHCTESYTVKVGSLEVL